MRTIVKNNAKALAVALTAAMVLSATAVPTSEAKAKKPKLSTKKVSVEVGAAKKVTVKNAKKVTWSINKAGKKAVALAKKSKKGVTIKGKAAGKAKVTAKMKYGKKTLKKTIKVTVTKKAAQVSAATPSVAPSAAPSAAPSVAPSAAPSAKPSAMPSVAPTTTPDLGPTPLPGYDKVVKVNLADYVLPEDNDNVQYYAATGQLNVKDTSLFRFNLPESLPTDSELDVTVEGTLNGEVGFRAYMIPQDQDTSMCSEIANSEDDGYTTGQFKWNFKLTNDNGDADQIQFKGRSYNENIDDLTISSIVIHIKKAK